MKPLELIDQLNSQIKIGFSTMIWGPPGIGKSQIVGKVAKDNEYKLLDIRLSTKAPEDIHGLPMFKGERTIWTKSDIFPEEGVKTLLFFDEITHADGRLRKAAFQIILDRQIGKYKLPDDTVIFAAGNRVEDRSGAQPMELALKNRFMHFELDVDLNDFSVWWIKQGYDDRILAYIRQRPDNLHNMPETMLDDNAFPTPRTWEIANRVLEVCPRKLRLAGLKGAIGPGAALEFEKYLRMDLPDAKDILNNPDSFDPATESVSVQYAMAGALAAAVSNTTMEAFLELIEKFEPEYAVYMTKDLHTRHPELLVHKSFIEWAGRNKNLIY